MLSKVERALLDELVAKIDCFGFSLRIVKDRLKLINKTQLWLKRHMCRSIRRLQKLGGVISIQVIWCPAAGLGLFTPHKPLLDQIIIYSLKWNLTVVWEVWAWLMLILLEVFSWSLLLLIVNDCLQCIPVQILIRNQLLNHLWLHLHLVLINSWSCSWFQSVQIP